MWDVDTNDWRKEKSIEKIIKSASETKEDRIVLIHERNKTMSAINAISRKFFY
jgi:hypothetical protein